MLFDIYYTEKKPLPLKETEKEKILKIILFSNENKDKILETYIFLNWKTLVGHFNKYAKPAYVKNQFLYVQVESKLVFQELLFCEPQINNILIKNVGYEIKGLKEIPSYFFKEKKSLVHTLKKQEEETNREERRKENKNLVNENLKLINDIKNIIKKNEFNFNNNRINF